ncbi:MAG: hypothetical protein JW774_03680 [Candidatus Aureabacteria bacterium]|nr:hypothetical protein [Candidatus Auribacterota bacterium]
MIFIRMNTREKLLFQIVIIAGLSWLILFFFVFPGQDRIARIKKEIEGKRLKLFQYQNAMKEEGTLEQKMAEIGQIPRLSASEEIEKSKLLKVIESVQQKIQGIQLLAMTPVESEKLDINRKLLVKIELEGTMENIVRFIYELKETPEKINLVNLRISSENIEGDKLRASFIVGQLLTVQ